MHYRFKFNDCNNLHLGILKRARFCDLGQMFTPPKSKSPWEAMTKGSTGGWAAPLYDWGPALTGAMGATTPFNPFAPFLSAGMGAAGMGGGKTGFQGTDYGWNNLGSTALGGLAGYGLGGAGAGIGGALGGALKSGIGGALSGFGQGLGSYGSATTKPFTSMFGQPSAFTGSYSNPSASAYSPSSLTGNAYSSAGQNFGANALVGVNANAASIYPYASFGTGQAATDTGKNWFSNLFGSAKGAINPTTLLGAGVASLGALKNGPTTVPESPYFGEYSSRLTGGTPFSQWGQNQAQNLAMDWNKPEFSPVSEDVYGAAVRKNKEEEANAEKQMRTEYKGIRPGADVESDSGFRQDLMKMREKFANERMALNTELSFNREKEYTGRVDQYFANKGNYLTNQLKLSQDQIAQYANLAQLDQDRLMAQTGLDAGQTAQFKNLFGDIGQMMMMQGMGMDFNSLVKMMGGAK